MGNDAVEDTGTDRSAAERGHAQIESLSAFLTEVDEAERYRLLAGLLSDLAERSRSGQNGRAPAEQLKELVRKTQALEKTRADLEDALRAARDDLRDRDSRLATEQARLADLQARLEAGRTRLEALDKERSDLESQLVARNAELHAAECQRENLLVEKQRNAADSEARRQLQALEQDNLKLREDLGAVRHDMELLRGDKNACIEQLEQQLCALTEAGQQSTTLVPQPLWDRLAAAKLASAGSSPTPQSMQRLVESFVVLADFVGEFDKILRESLTVHLKRDRELNVAWQGYTSGDPILQMIQKVLSPGLSTISVQALRAKLRIGWRFGYAHWAVYDDILKKLAVSLKEQLGEFISKAGGKASIPDFIRTGGHDTYEASIRSHHVEQLKNIIMLGA